MGINSYTIVNRLEAAAAKQYQTLGPISLTTATAVPLSAVSIPASQVEIYGYKSAGANTLPVNNTAACYVSIGGRALDPIPAGGKVTYAQDGTKFDLDDISIVGTTGDAVFVKYLQ